MKTPSFSNGILMEMTIEDVRSFHPEVVVLALTSTEPHGPHLPYGTDYYIGDGITREAVQLANQSGARVLMYPSLPVGNNVNFQHFPFACRMRVRTYMNVLLDIIEALEQDGIRKIVLTNSHGGNVDTIKAVLREHFERHPANSLNRAFVSYCAASGMATAEAARVIEHPSEHAGEKETSLIQHFRPELVREENFADFEISKAQLPELCDGRVHFVRAWEHYMPESCGGETRHSHPEKGKILADSAASGLANHLIGLSKAPWHPGFPYSTTVPLA